MIFTNRTSDSHTTILRRNDDKEEYVVNIENQSDSYFDNKAEPSAFDNRSTVDLKNELAHLESFIKPQNNEPRLNINPEVYYDKMNES